MTRGQSSNCSSSSYVETSAGMLCGSDQATDSGKPFLSYQGKFPHSLSLSLLFCGDPYFEEFGGNFSILVIFYFAGIPFAAPPVGSLRLRAPEPAQPWPGVLDVSGRPRVVCPQLNYFQAGIIEGQEDCLYLNVYTPGNNSTYL